MAMQANTGKHVIALDHFDWMREEKKIYIIMYTIIEFHRVWDFTIADLAFLSPLGANFNFYVIDSCGIP